MLRWLVSSRRRSPRRTWPSRRLLRPRAWSRPAGSWFTSNTGNLVSGDVDGDGRPDITTSYNYATGATRIFTFHGNEAGGVDSPMPSWYARPGTW
ncbi:hypothetical protein [Streptomyces hydrogenans]|uniref:hypothetical protein n=1 Tax=Streptomyces hydrogenans TaxID=1873719 RepID=UPI0037F2ABF2